MTADELQTLLQARSIEFTAKKIPHGRQFRLSDGAIASVYARGKIVWQGKTTDTALKLKELYAAPEPLQAVAASKGDVGTELRKAGYPIDGKDLSDDGERLSRIATIFGNAVKQARDFRELNIDEEMTVDAHVDHVHILVGGCSKVLFNINAEGSIRGPVFGFQDTAKLGSINDDGVELSIAWAIKNELFDQNEMATGALRPQSVTARHSLSIRSLLKPIARKSSK
jgi:hypothetical protein